MKPLVSATAILALSLSGCARDRDFAVVEPTLSRQYQAGTIAVAAPPTSANVVGVQPVAGQRGIVQPVYQSQPTAVPLGAAGPAAVGTVVLPPASSTGATAAGQPYYAPPPTGPAAPVAPPPSLAPAPGFVASNPGVPAGVYPTAATGMWMPTNGNQAVAIHQFPTPTTGSNFTPSMPMDGSTPSTLRTADGVVQAGAMVPFESMIPLGSVPQKSRTPFMSETGENQQPSRITPLPRSAEPPLRKVERDTEPTRPPPGLEEPTDPPLGRRPARSAEPPPVLSKDDSEPPLPLRKPGEKMDAQKADPPRSSPRKDATPLTKEAPDNIKLPPKKVEFDLGESSTKKKSPPNSDDSGPAPVMPDEPPPPAKTKKSGV